jgi:hypothetical protein
VLTGDAAARRRAATPFLALGVAAIIAGGLVAAAVAHHPAEHPVWTSAYLVLIVGVAQMVLGAGQAWLSERLPSIPWIAGEWLVFNLGNAGVIAGTLFGSFRMVLAGTALFAAGIVAFLLGARGPMRRGWLAGYRILLGLIFLSSLAGLALSLRAH